jgi:hypothetical protein
MVGKIDGRFDILGDSIEIPIDGPRLELSGLRKVL